MRSGIVDGSIGECAAAIELTRAGHHVTVFERERGEPSDEAPACSPSR